MFIVVHGCISGMFYGSFEIAWKEKKRERERERENEAHIIKKTAVKLWLNYKGNPLGLQSSMACREETFILDIRFFPKTDGSPCTVYLGNEDVVNHKTSLSCNDTLKIKVKCNFYSINNAKLVLLIWAAWHIASTNGVRFGFLLFRLVEVCYFCNK